MNKSSLIKLAGGIWVAVGMFLIIRGSILYQQAMAEQHATQTAILISILAGLVIGAIKGKFILSKTARRNRNRIENLESPVKIHQLFAKPFYIFIIGMMFLGVLLRSQNELLGGYVVVAAIYCGIGAALIVSSLVYWKTKPETIAEETS